MDDDYAILRSVKIVVLFNMGYMNQGGVLGGGGLKCVKPGFWGFWGVFWGWVRLALHKRRSNPYSRPPLNIIHIKDINIILYLYIYTGGGAI
jgi:hypothetical protein